VAFFRYTLARLGLLAVVFVICLYLGLGLVFSGIFAVIISWCLSYLLLRKWRDEASAAMQNRFPGRIKPIRTATEVEDAAAEDALVDNHPDVAVDADRKRRQDH
jgi:Protein of unknown function (DUF4229)